MADSQRVSLDEIIVHFQELEDPRSTINQRHPLASMLVIALLAVLAGAAGPTAIDRWSALKEELLARVLDAPPGNNAENLAWLRKLALCLLKAEKTSKAKSIQRRRHLAGWKDAYLLKVLAQIPEKRGA